MCTDKPFDPSPIRDGCVRATLCNRADPPFTATLNALERTAIVLHGPTSAGKSSLAKALQANAPIPAFHVSLDAFVTMSNRRDMRSDEQRDQAYQVHCENLRSTPSRVVSTQFDLILDLVLRDKTESDCWYLYLQRRRSRSTHWKLHPRTIAFDQSTQADAVKRIVSIRVIARRGWFPRWRHGRSSLRTRSSSTTFNTEDTGD